MVACGNNGSGQWGKYLLDVAKVQGTEVTSATAALSTTNNEWQVNLTLNSAGAAAFSTLTSDMYTKYYSAGQAGDENSAVLNQLAVALDGNVVTVACRSRAPSPAGTPRSPATSPRPRPRSCRT